MSVDERTRTSGALRAAGSATAVLMQTPSGMAFSSLRETVPYLGL